MYSRFTTLLNHSEEDQRKLEKSTAAVVGLGATGSAIAENLARHGVNLVIIDRDYLEPKDTYSSSIYTPEQCENALPKARAAEKYLENFTDAEAYSESLSSENLDILESADIILDGTDNLETRQLINDYSKRENVPWVYTAAIAERAYSMPFIEKCFNCMVQKPEKVATCETDGIMREVAQKAAASSSMKAVKYLTGRKIEEKLKIIHKNRLLEVENSGCNVCTGEEYPHIENTDSATKVCGQNKFQMEKQVTEQSTQSAIKNGKLLVENDFLVRIEYEDKEITFFRSGRIIAEAEDEGHAEALVSEVAGI